MRLFARLRAFLLPAHTQMASLRAQVADLQERVKSCEEALETQVEREIKWAEMNAQLRRYLGRLDAHAGHDKQKETNGRGGARADVIAAKYPNGLPTKE